MHVLVMTSPPHHDPVGMQGIHGIRILQIQGVCMSSIDQLLKLCMSVYVAGSLYRVHCCKSVTTQVSLHYLHECGTLFHAPCESARHAGPHLHDGHVYAKYMPTYICRVCLHTLICKSVEC